MKKILGLTIAAVLVMGLVGGGTWAFFSDTETANANILQAGTLDLTLDGGDSDYKIVDTSVSNVYPGASGSASVELENAGSLDGELEVVFGSVTNTGLNDGSEFADASGDLGDSVNVTLSVYIDVNQNGSWDSGDIDLEPDGSAVGYDSDNTLDTGTINTYGGKTWDNVYGGVAQFASGATDNFTISWNITTGATNEIQGDSAQWDITFILEQDAVD